MLLSFGSPFSFQFIFNLLFRLSLKKRDFYTFKFYVFFFFFVTLLLYLQSLDKGTTPTTLVLSK